MERLSKRIFRDLDELYELDYELMDGIVTIGGIVEWNNRTMQVARAYKWAADELVKNVIQDPEPHLTAFPIFFLYRHTVELYLKALLRPQRLNHDLQSLIDQFIQHARIRTLRGCPNG